MPKKTLFISAAMTAFILVIAASVANAYQQASVAAVPAEVVPAVVEVAAIPTALPTAVPTPTEAVVVSLTPQEAAMVAANYLEQTDLYSVELVIWEGIEAYKVVFSSGDVVYVSLTGEIVSTEEPSVVYVTKKNNNNNTGTTAEHNNHDDDDHDDDDD